MRLALGIDAVEVARVARVLARHPRRFGAKHFTATEWRDAGGDAARIAARWAAKEAAVKALGTGFGPVGWREVEVVCGPRGAPSLHLHGAARDRAAALGLTHWTLSLTHTAELAVAVVAGAGEASSLDERSGTDASSGADKASATGAIRRPDARWDRPGRPGVGTRFDFM